MIALRTLFARLRRNRSGVALTEFALSLPLLMGAGMWGLELANFATVNMRISQLAIHLADNASRVGDTSMLTNRKIYEADIDDVFRGASIQSGRLEFFKHGRAIISSLEVVPGTENDQYIHWQRCLGKKALTSSYGDEGDTVTGMGPAGRQITTFKGEAVIFVEIEYDYQPLISSRFVGNNPIKAIATFTVRDSRDLSQIYQRNAGSPDPVALCSAYTETI